MSKLLQILETNINIKAQLKDSIEINEVGFEFFHIQEITFQDKDEVPRREALENVLGSLRVEGVNFVYLILGDENRISFYFGLAKNRKNIPIDVDDLAKQILKPNIEGNFRGSKIQRVSKPQKKEIKETLKNYKYIAQVSGIPDVNEEAKTFQGVDRLVDIMLKDKFALMIIAEQLTLDEIENIEKELYKIYDEISPEVKKTLQTQTTKTTTNNETTSKSNTTSNSESESASATDTNQTSNSKTTTRTKSNSKNSNESSSKQESETENSSKSDSTTKSKSVNSSINETKTNSISHIDNKTTTETENKEFAKKELEEWLKYIDEILLKRLDYSKGKGGFKSGIYLFADTKGKIAKLGNSFISLFGSVKENRVPLKYKYVDVESVKNIIYNFQLPKYEIANETLMKKMILKSKIDGIEWFSTKELSLIASLPQKEVVGLRLKEEVEFGLNISQNEGINLGKMVRSGQELDIDVNLEKSELNKHIFITGVTGSGKTTTCHKILYESNLPFLVIEPAKTEYRVLSNVDDIVVFTLGNENIAPFRLNPFEILEGENISSRVDMIKAAIESSFDMEAAIPQLIESAIYKSYKDYGWDIATSENYKYDNPFDKGVKSFPTLSDVISNVDKVVEEQNFDDRLKRDYIGSIKARLNGLILGSKGFMLDTPRSFDFKSLLKKKVILELEEIKNPSEKSFIMGLILLNLNEALKSIYKEDKSFRHITLVEEAHRLLSKYEAGDSLNKKSGVEAFSDMLAEVRKYGESLMIVDQIPNKLTPEVLKNTNTKIVHRIFAIDDKEAIGNTMALSKEQKEFLSKLEVGRAIVFNQKFYNAIQVQIKELENISTTLSEEVGVEKLREKWLEFYKEENRLNFTLKELENLVKLDNLFLPYVKAEKENDEEKIQRYKKAIYKIVINLDTEAVANFLYKRVGKLSRRDIKRLTNQIKEI
jgi:DNA helicase HerA-like ATPase